MNGTYECNFIEGCEEESSEYMLKETFDNDRILLKNSQDWKKNIVAWNLLGFIVFIT